MFTTGKSLILLAVSAFFAGIVNGFLGTGGGIILTFALTLINTADSDAKDRFATVIAVILPLSAVSVLLYGNTASLSDAAPYIPAGILGGVTGAFLLDRLKVGIVKRLFAAMVIWAGISFIG